MVMSVTEASAAQDVLRVAAAHIQQLRQSGITTDTILEIDDTHGYTLGAFMASGHVLAEQSYKKLYAGIDGNRWDQLIEPEAD